MDKCANHEQENKTLNLEDILWQALGMDSLQDKMTSKISANKDAMFIGTGATVNACYMCDNSHKNC